MLADSVGLALLVVLDRLPPAERLAYVLHDMFNLPFEEIALIVERSQTAARQLASRARRRVQGPLQSPTSISRASAAVTPSLIAIAISPMVLCFMSRQRSSAFASAVR